VALRCASHLAHRVSGYPAKGRYISIHPFFLSKLLIAPFARARPLAVRKIFNVASGNTTEAHIRAPICPPGLAPCGKHAVYSSEWRVLWARQRLWRRRRRIVHHAVRRQPERHPAKPVRQQNASPPVRPVMPTCFVIQRDAVTLCAKASKRIQRATIKKIVIAQFGRDLLRHRALARCRRAINGQSPVRPAPCHGNARNNRGKFGYALRIVDTMPQPNAASEKHIAMRWSS